MKNKFLKEILKNIKVAHGDSLSIIKKIDDTCIDLILTDPPYNLGAFMKKRDTNMGQLRKNHFSATDWDHIDEKTWIKKMDTFLNESSRIIKKGGSMIIFMSLMKIETIIKIAEKYNFYYKTTGVWHKKNPLPRNMNLHFVNSVEGWVYFTFGTKTGTFNNKNKMIHDFIETFVITKDSSFVTVQFAIKFAIVLFNGSVELSFTLLTFCFLNRRGLNCLFSVRFVITVSS